MYEATACILQTVAFSLQKRYFYNLISLLAVEKNELKRVKKHDIILTWRTIDKVFPSVCLAEAGKRYAP